MKKVNSRQQLEDTYQDIAYLISKNSYHYEIIENEYPKLVVKHIYNNEQFEIIIKKVK